METLTTTTTTTEDTTAVDAETPGTWERIELEVDRLEDAIERMVREGSIRRIVVKRDGVVIAEFPLAAGVVGTVLAAPVAGIAAIVALLSDCTIEVERVEPTPEAPAAPAAAADDSVMAEPLTVAATG